MTPPITLRLAPDIIAVRVANEIVTWHRVTGRLNLLDPVATQVVARLDGRSTEQVITALCGAFDVPAERIRRDVQALLTELEQLGVLVTDA